jgi:hypothetical protein
LVGIQNDNAWLRYLLHSIRPYPDASATTTEDNECTVSRNDE